MTIAVITRPFGFEGRRRAAQAEAGIKRLRDKVDTQIVIPNDRLLSIADEKTSMVAAFRMADEILLQGVSGIADLITTPGLINTDFADVRMIMHEAGSALMGIGRAGGENRALSASRAAIASPLLEASIEGARGILLTIAGSSDLGLFEVSEAAEIIHDVAHPDANIIFGTVVDENLGEEIQVTVIAAGFDRYEDDQFDNTIDLVDDEEALVTNDHDDFEDDYRDSANGNGHRRNGESSASRELLDLFQEDEDPEDDFDVPSFLR